MRTHLLLAATALVLAACVSSDKVDTAGAPAFGHAVTSNMAAQVSHGPVSTRPPEGTGTQGALAQDRYNTGRTKPLLPSGTSTTNATSSAR